jgi:hypothetical protein
VDPWTSRCTSAQRCLAPSRLARVTFATTASTRSSQLENASIEVAEAVSWLVRTCCDRPLHVSCKASKTINQRRISRVMGCMDALWSGLLEQVWCPSHNGACPGLPLTAANYRHITNSWKGRGLKAVTKSCEVTRMHVMTCCKCNSPYTRFSSQLDLSSIVSCFVDQGPRSRACWASCVLSFHCLCAARWLHITYTDKYRNFDAWLRTSPAIVMVWPPGAAHLRHTAAAVLISTTGEQHHDACAINELSHLHVSYMTRLLLLLLLLPFWLLGRALLCMLHADPATHQPTPASQAAHSVSTNHSCCSCHSRCSRQS